MKTVALSLESSDEVRLAGFLCDSPVTAYQKLSVEVIFSDAGPFPSALSPWQKEQLTVYKVDPSYLYAEFSLKFKVLSDNLIDFSFAEFFTEFVGRFAFSGGYNDVEINESELESFLKEKTDSLEYLATCHIEKINQHKVQNPKKRRKSKPKIAMTKTTKKKRKYQK